MHSERRQDIGLKMVYVGLTAIITILLSLFFNKTYNLAEGANDISIENKRDIAVLQQVFKDVDRRLMIIDNKLDKALQ